MSRNLKPVEMLSLVALLGVLTPSVPAFAAIDNGTVAPHARFLFEVTECLGPALNDDAMAIFENGGDQAEVLRKILLAQVAEKCPAAAAGQAAWDAVMVREAENDRTAIRAEANQAASDAMRAYAAPKPEPANEPAAQPEEATAADSEDSSEGAAEASPEDSGEDVAEESPEDSSEDVAEESSEDSSDDSDGEE